MPKPTSLPPAVRAELRALARQSLALEFRQRGDLQGVEILLGPLPEIERWAIASARHA